MVSDFNGSIGSWDLNCVRNKGTSFTSCAFACEGSWLVVKLECHSPLPTIHKRLQSKVSFSKTSKFSAMIPKLNTYFLYHHSFHSNFIHFIQISLISCINFLSINIFKIVCNLDAFFRLSGGNSEKTRGFRNRSRSYDFGLLGWINHKAGS